MKRLIAYAGIAILCSVGGYLVGFQHGTYRSAVTYASLDTDSLHSTAPDTKTLPAVLRDSRYPIIIEISNADANRPYLSQNTQYSLADADKWLSELSARYENCACVVVVAHDGDPVGTVSAIVEISKKNNYPAHTVFLNYSNGECYTMAFSKIKRTPDWEWFMQTYHMPSPAAKFPALDILQVRPSPTSPIWTDSSHN
jgi:hypothetical protein